MEKLFDAKIVFTSIPSLLKAFPVTLELTIVSAIIGLLLGLVIALVRMNKVPVLTQLAVGYVSIIRGTPVLVQLYIFYFGIPLILKYINYQCGTNYNINAIPSIFFAMVALGINQSAFDSETIRAALQSVERGQIEAAKALGMTREQMLRRIIIPEAISVALLPLGNSVINLIKGTSLAFTCAVIEMTAQGKIIAGRNFRYFEIYCSLAIIYWIITFLLEKMIKLIEKKISVPEVLPLRDESGKILRRKQFRKATNNL